MKNYRSRYQRVISGRLFEAVIPRSPVGTTHIFVDGKLLEVLDKESLEEAANLAEDIVKKQVLSEQE